MQVAPSWERRGPSNRPRGALVGLLHGAPAPVVLGALVPSALVFTTAPHLPTSAPKLERRVTCSTELNLCAMRICCLQLANLLLFQVASAPNTLHETSAIWQHVKRCDMLEHASNYDATKGTYTTMHGGWAYPWPSYTNGEWVAARHAVTAVVPMDCDGTVDVCPLASTGCDSSTISGLVCQRYHHACYADRRSDFFSQNLDHLKWVWQPSNGCHFSPVAPLGKWFEWAAARESDAGPMMFVGDTLLSELFMAFSQLTSGAKHSDFIRSDNLVNSWTLAPMTTAQVASCTSTAGASSGSATVPCPPLSRSPTLWWEDNSHHQCAGWSRGSGPRLAFLLQRAALACTLPPKSPPPSAGWPISSGCRLLKGKLHRSIAWS